jgi:hypothetical protein
MSNENKGIVFKSSGNSLKEAYAKNINNNLNNIPVPLGIKTPLELSAQDDLFKMHYNLEDIIEDNLKNLIRTEPGERLCFPSLGTLLKNILSRTDIDNVDELAMQEITRAINIYYPPPLISLISFTSYKDAFESEKQSLPVLIVKISYTIPIVSDRRKELIIKLGMNN